MSSDRTPADVIAQVEVIRYGFDVDEDDWEELGYLDARKILAALAAAGFRVVPEPDDTTQAARIVATYWRDHMMAADGVLRGCAHPLAMVLAALDGETDPARLGVDPESAAAAYLSGDRKERPAECPECGSDDPAICAGGGLVPHQHGGVSNGRCCPDSWHGVGVSR